MKKIWKTTKAIAVALAVMGLPLNIFADLKIYKVRGDVTVKSGTSTSKAEKRQKVMPGDMLTIPRNASVSVLDTKNNRVFTSLSQGKMTVKQLIEEAENNASNVTRTTNEMVWEAVAENAKTKTNRFGIAGASVHEANEAIHAPINLPAGVSYLAYLRGLDEQKEYDDEYDAILVRRDINYDDETFKFAVFNTLSQPLYFNIIQQRTDREPELFFLDNPVAAPRTQTIVDEYLYIVPDYRDGYIVVASDKDFTISDVKKLLDPSYEPEADFYFTLLRK